MSMYLVFNVGCIECGVSSAVVGVFADKDVAEKLAHRLSGSHSWREGGQNNFEVYELPEPELVASEYAEAAP